MRNKPHFPKSGHICLIVSQEVKEEWQLDPLLKLVEREVKARERSTASSIPVSNTTPKPPPRFPPTSAFIAGSSSAPSCVYCQDSHTSLSCKKVVGAEPRRAILKSAGRCFVCLRKNHLGRNCRSDSKCHNCQGRHHTSICFRRNPTNTTDTNTRFTDQNSAAIGLLQPS